MTFKVETDHKPLVLHFVVKNLEELPAKLCPTLLFQFKRIFVQLSSMTWRHMQQAAMVVGLFLCKNCPYAK